MSPKSFALLLLMTPKIGDKTVSRVLARNALLGRTPEDFLSLSPEAHIEEYRLTAIAAQNLKTQFQEIKNSASKMEIRLGELGVSLVTLTDIHYPGRIEQFESSPPGVLFLYGNQKLLAGKTFSVVSSRNAPPAALEKIEARAEAGVLAGEILVSGHDREEYQRSAIVPLRWGAPRILVLDRGLFKVLGENLKDEAFKAARLWRYEFDPRTDLVVSPFRPNDDFVGANNRTRDRLIVGLSDRVEFCHLSESGNMNTLAKTAIQCGRKVSVSDHILHYREFVRLGATVIENQPAG